MKNTIYKGLFSLMFVFVLNFSIYAQKPDKETIKIPTFSELMKDKNNSYFDIQGQIEKHPEIIRKLSPKMQKRYARWQYWWSSRVGKDGNFTAANEAFMDFIDEEKRNTNRESSSRYVPCGSTCTNSGLASGFGESIGPNEYPSAGSNNNSRLIGQGRMNKIWVNPFNSAIMYAGADTGGLWKTTNGNSLQPHWVCLTDDIPLCGVADFIIDPSNINVIYIASRMHANGTIGTGFTNEWIYSGGVLKSSDGGLSWSKLNLNAPVADNAFTRLIFDPTNTNIVYALAHKTVYKTTNGGLSWDNTNVPDTDPMDPNPMGTGLLKKGTMGFFNIVIDSSNPQILYISGHQFFYKTTDGGVTWINLHSMQSFKDFAYSQTQISIDLIQTSTGNELYAMLYENSGSNSNNEGVKIIKSLNGGTSWNLVSDNTSIKAARWVTILKLSPNGDIYGGGINLRRKSSNSSDWFLASSGTHDDVRFLLFPDPNDSNIMLQCDDGGLWKTENRGSNWTNITGNISASQCYNIAYSENNPDVFMTGAQDIGNYLYQNGSWGSINNAFNLGFGDGGKCLIDYQNNSVRYIMTNNLLKRVESGVISNSLIETEVYNGPLLMHPEHSQTLYVGDETHHLKVSLNKGETWNFANPNDGNDARVTAIAISSANTNYMYYSDLIFNFDTYPWTVTNRIWKSTNGGQNWELLNIPSPSGIFGSKITSINVHPADPSRVFLTFGNFNNENKVFESLDGGETWSNITYNLPNLPTQCLIFDSRNNQIYLGTDVGVYYKCVDDNFWTLATGVPRVIISDLQINNTSGELLVATYGRGIWKVQLNNYCSSDNTLFINASQTWTNTRSLCSDLVVNAGKTLTISGLVIMPMNSEIIIKSGGTLILDGSCSKIIYANVIAESGAHIIMKHGATLERAKGDKFDVLNGALFDDEYGKIIDISK